MAYAVAIASYGAICVQSIMKINTYIQTVLTFNLSNFGAFNVGIIDGRCMKCAFEMGSGVMICTQTTR
jgi:hypothetical protein